MNVPGTDLRHLLVLEELDRQVNVSQRALGERVGLAPSLVNRLIRELTDSGYVEVVDRSVRPFEYRITSSGDEYLHQLNRRHLRSIMDSFRDLQDRIRRRLSEIRGEGVRSMVFYGTGEVMEVTLPLAQAMGMEIVGLVDDDGKKHGETKSGIVIGPPGTILDLDPDAVLITTLRHAREIQDRVDGDLRDAVRFMEL